MPDTELKDPEIECKYVPKTILELVMFKSDRTIAVIGIVVIGCLAILLGDEPLEQIAIAAVGGLVGYIGGRTGN